MSKWKKVSFGDVIIKRNKSPFQVSDAQNYGNYNFFTSGENILRHENYLVDGENLFLSTGGKALIKYYSGKANYSTDTYVISSSTIYPKYLYYFLQSIIDYINNNLFSGSGLKHLQKKVLNAMIIKYPPLLIQTRIAEILSTADKAIEDSEKLIAKYKRMKTGMMQDLLTKGIDENGNIRSEATHKFKDSPLGRIPEEWEVNNIKYFCENGNGSIQTGPFGSQLHFKDYKEEGTPIITVEHLLDNRIFHDNLPLVNDSDYNRLDKYILNTGDLVFSRVGSIDRCSIVSEDENGWLFSGRCLRVRPGAKFNSFYLLYQLNNSFTKNWILSNAVGSTMKCLNTSILSDLPTIMPSIIEQEKISNRLTEIDKHIEIETETLSKLKRLKIGLMNDLLSGKVDVVDSGELKVDN